MPVPVTSIRPKEPKSSAPKKPTKTHIATTVWNRRPFDRMNPVALMVLPLEVVTGWRCSGRARSVGDRSTATGEAGLGLGVQRGQRPILASDRAFAHVTTWTDP